MPILLDYTRLKIKLPLTVKDLAHGTLYCVNNCPVTWGSKLQTSTALSTMEAEYVAVSAACRELLPLQKLFHEISTQVALPIDVLISINSTIWEDNEGTLKLANMPLPRFTSKSKHFACKFHWFRDHVSNGSDNMASDKFLVKPIATSHQLVNIFTKGLVGSTF